jgi:GNAT superfamily N-acetyltransferase
MVTVRPAVAADIPAMHAIRVAVRENALSSPARIRAADYEVALAHGCGWVAELGPATVGFAFGLLDGNVWALFVDPAHEGRGAGSKLHAVLVDWLERHARRPIWLGTGPGTRAERFYRARGWRDCGIVASGERRFEWPVG